MPLILMMLAGVPAYSHGASIELGSQTLTFVTAVPLQAFDSCSDNVNKRVF